MLFILLFFFLGKNHTNLMLLFLTLAKFIFISFFSFAFFVALLCVSGKRILYLYFILFSLHTVSTVACHTRWWRTVIANTFFWFSYIRNREREAEKIEIYFKINLTQNWVLLSKIFFRLLKTPFFSRNKIYFSSIMISPEREYRKGTKYAFCIYFPPLDNKNFFVFTTFFYFLFFRTTNNSQHCECDAP
jgi:hypothetical protein